MTNNIVSSANTASTAAPAWRRAVIDYAGMVLALIALCAVFGYIAPSFLSYPTFLTVANQVPVAILIAIAMTFVLITGEIDLSVGSVAGLCGAVLGVAMTAWHWPLLPAALLCVATGAVCGLINGLITVKWKLPSFIVTLGMLEAARGAAYLTASSKTQYIGNAVECVSRSTVFGVSAVFLGALFMVVAGQVILTRTVFGRRMIAVGTNEEAVRLSGIDPRPIKVAVFTISGALVGLASIILCSRLGAADPNAGSGFELAAIAAAVIGGPSLSGGRGNVVNSLFGVLIISVLTAGLAQANASEPTKRLITGIVIVAAVILDQIRRKR